LHVINDILDYREMESGRINKFIESFSLKNLIQEIQDYLITLANKKNIKLEFEIIGDLQPYYNSDKRIIRTILNNLVQNAIKFTETGGVKIIVNAQEIAEDKQKLSISIKDTGIGFDTAYTEDIFNGFTQLSDDFNITYGGTGLGLALVKELAKSLNGDIEVESIPGKGSTFTLHLDMQISKTTIDQDNESSLDQEFTLKDIKVLLAEDDEFTIFLTQKMLKDWGMDVKIVKDGMEAINACKFQAFDVILMDIQMPNCDGIEATRRIKENSLNVDTPIIGFTANVDSETRIKGTAAGMDTFIYKPFQKDEMYRVLLRTVVNANA
jgi:CheY-like chemotaxis protein/two-component sensor histidine kinase